MAGPASLASSQLQNDVSGDIVEPSLSESCFMLEMHQGYYMKDISEGRRGLYLYVKV